MNAAVSIRITQEATTVTLALDADAGPPITLSVADTTPAVRAINSARDDRERPAERFQPASNGDAVLDTRTGLMWSRDNVAEERLNWNDADKACRNCQIGGHSDWRLPTIQELLTLVDYERHEPAIDTDAFTCESAWYWSSSAAAWSPESCAWIVDFDYGGANDLHRNHDAFVRAVRVASAPASQ